MTSRIAAVYGPNASGKSTLLRALWSLARAVFGERDVLFEPHLFDGAHVEEPTEYRIEFVHDGVRYEYEVHAHVWGISYESLRRVVVGWNRVFLRQQAGPDAPISVVRGDALKGATAQVKKITTSRELFLATALRYEHFELAPIAQAFSMIRFIHHDDDEKDARLQWVIQLLASGGKYWKRLFSEVVKMADLGVNRIEIEEREVSKEGIERMRRLFSSVEGRELDIPESLLMQMRRALVFFHQGADGKERRLYVGDQSAGTLTWLATAGPAVTTLGMGGVVVIDELDASLHPALTGALVELFKDETLNVRGAQLIFSTHDISLLDNSPIQLLESKEVWLTSKSPTGASELYSIADFGSNRVGTNKFRRYVAGAYGAVPSVSVSGVHRLLSDLNRGVR